MSVKEIAEARQVISQHSLGAIGFSGLMTAAAKFMKGVEEDSFTAFGEELYKKHIARKIYPENRANNEAHQAQGHRVAIITSATIYPRKGERRGGKRWVSKVRTGWLPDD